MKFKAPADVTGIFTRGIEYRADENGIVEIDDEGDAVTLAANGWQRLDDEAAPAAAPADEQPAVIRTAATVKPKPAADDPPPPADEA